MLYQTKQSINLTLLTLTLTLILITKTGRYKCLLQNNIIV